MYYFSEEKMRVVDLLFHFLSRDIQLAVKMSEHYTVVNELTDERDIINKLRNSARYDASERSVLMGLRTRYMEELNVIYDG